MRFFCLVFGLFISIGIYALPDTLQIHTDKKSTLEIGSDYAGNTNTFGHFNNFVTQPLFSPFISYFGKRGLFASGLIDFIGNSDSTNTKTTSELDLQVGYRWDISDHFSIVPSVTHFFYSPNSNSFKSGFTDYLQVDFGAEFNWWYATVSTGYIMGNSNQFIAIPQTGVSIQFDHFLGKNNSLSVQPSVSLDFNNQDYFNQYYRKKYLFLKPYYTKNPDATVGEFITDYTNGLTDFNKLTRLYFNRFFTNHPRFLEKMKNLPQDELLKKLTDIGKETKFTLTSIGLTLPIYYSMGNLTLNFTFSAYKPMNQPDYLDSNWITYSSFGVSYSFGFKK
jgi:hypothetical protein